jgi:hypothetical protein
MSFSRRGAYGYAYEYADRLLGSAAAQTECKIFTCAAAVR